MSQSPPVGGSTPPVHTPTPESPQGSAAGRKWDHVKSGVQWTFVALAVLALAVGLIGSFAMSGHLESLLGFGLSNVAPYATLAGLGGFTIITALVGVAMCLRRNKAAAQTGESKPWISCSFCSKKPTNPNPAT